MATTERDYYELLGVSRTASADEIRTSQKRPMPTTGSAKSSRPTRSSPTRSGASSTTASATRGCAAAASSRPRSTSAASRICSPPFSGTTCSAGEGGAGGAAAAPTSPRASRSISRRWRPGRSARCPSASPFRASVAEGTVQSPTPRSVRVRPAEAAAACARFHAASSGSSCAPERVPPARARGSSSSIRVRSATARVV